MWRDWPGQVCAATGREGFVYSRRGYGRSESDSRRAGRRSPGARLHASRSRGCAARLAGGPGHRKPGPAGPFGRRHHRPAPRQPSARDRLRGDGAPRHRGGPVRAGHRRRRGAAYESGALRDRLQRYHADVDCAFWQWNDIWLSPDFRRSISGPTAVISRPNAGDPGRGRPLWVPAAARRYRTDPRPVLPPGPGAMRPFPASRPTGHR